MSESMCIINAKNGMGTSSPQVTQFSHNCDCIKFIVDKDFTNYAVVVIASIEGEVMVVSEGDALKNRMTPVQRKPRLCGIPHPK